MTVETGAVRERAQRLLDMSEADARAMEITIATTATIVLLAGVEVPALCDALEAERERVRVLREALQWYADERNYDEIGRPGVYVPGSTAGGFVQDPDWDTDDGWRAERALEAALATAGGEGATP